MVEQGNKLVIIEPFPKKQIRFPKGNEDIIEGPPPGIVDSTEAVEHVRRQLIGPLKETAV